MQGPGALDQLGELTAKLTRRPLIIVDAEVLPFVERQLKAAFNDKECAILTFQGEVTRPAMEALAEQARGFDGDVVIGIGGGKGLDAAKGAAKRLKLRFIAIPSIASNDSPAGQAIAVYDDSHSMVAVEIIPESPLMVISDTALIANAPPRFLRAGIGDAIAKKFEAERANADGSINFFGTQALRTSFAIADGCYKTLRRFGAAGMAAAERHEPNEAFEAVVEANVLMSGLAWENGGLSYAHAVVRGLVKARGAANALHGEHVAYGTLVQMAIEERDDDFIFDLIGFNREVGLPVRLADMGMENPQKDEIAKIARLTSAGPKGGTIIVNATPEKIALSIERVEALAL